MNNSNSGDAIRFEGKLDFANGCEGLDILTSQRLRLGFADDICRYSEFTAATPITMKWTGNNKIGELAIIKAALSDSPLFFVFIYKRGRKWKEYTQSYFVSPVVLRLWLSTHVCM